MGEAEFGARFVRGAVDRELKRARWLLVGLGAATAIWYFLALNKLGDLDKIGVYLDAKTLDAARVVCKIGIAVGIAYLVCAALVALKPVIATVAAVVIYLAPLALEVIVDPLRAADSTWLAFHGVILAGLISAVHFARLYERTRAERALASAEAA